MANSSSHDASVSSAAQTQAELVSPKSEGFEAGFHGLTQASYPTAGTHPGDWTPRLASLFGQNIALVEGKTKRQRNYTELAEAVERSAHALHGMGIRPTDRVAVLAKNRLEIIEILFACARLGAIFVPLNWRLKEPELAFLLEDAQPDVLFVEEEFSHVLGNLQAANVKHRVLWSADPKAPAWYTSTWQPNSDAHSGGVPSLFPQAELQLDDPWCLLYTSGTTGHPKGALLPHRQIAFNAWNTLVALGLREDDSTVTYTPLFHTGALHVLTTPLLSCGGTIWLEDAFQPNDVLRLVAKGKISVLFGVPTTFEMLAADPQFDEVDFSSVRLALCGGAPCPLSLIQRYRKRDVIFKQGYGLTEVGPNCLNLNSADVERKAGSAGKPNLMVSVRLLNPEISKDTGRTKGELCLGGPASCVGYWRRPEVNEQVFTKDGYFRTGDLVEVDEEGFYFIVGRVKDMYISGGENVYPAEVERVLADHPDIIAAAVIGIADERWGEVGKAYVESRAAAFRVEEIRAWAKTKLANYKIPKHFVVVDALPRNASGKVQKHLLAHDNDGDSK